MARRYVASLGILAPDPGIYGPSGRLVKAPLAATCRQGQVSSPLQLRVPIGSREMPPHWLRQQEHSEGKT